MAEVVETKAKIEHLPTGKTWETPWKDASESDSIDPDAFTEDINTFLKGNEEIFVVNAGIFISLSRVTLQQCSVDIGIRTNVIEDGGGSSGGGSGGGDGGDGGTVTVPEKPSTEYTLKGKMSYFVSIYELGSEGEDYVMSAEYIELTDGYSELYTDELNATETIIWKRVFNKDYYGPNPATGGP